MSEKTINMYPDQCKLIVDAIKCLDDCLFEKGFDTCNVSLVDREGSFVLVIADKYSIVLDMSKGEPSIICPDSYVIELGIDDNLRDSFFEALVNISRIKGISFHEVSFSVGIGKLGINLIKGDITKFNSEEYIARIFVVGC